MPCTRTVEIVLPFCEIVIHVFIWILIVIPEHFPRLIRLRFSSYESPAIATDFFKIKYRIYFAHVVMIYTVEPLGANERPFIFFKLVNNEDCLFKISITMEIDKVGKLDRAYLLRSLYSALATALHTSAVTG